MKVKPMLAVTADLDKLEYPVYVDYKWDGIRALVIDSVVYSRSMKPIRSKQVQKMFGRPEYNGFDGELIVGNPFAPDVFQRTTSVVMSSDKTEKVVYHVFDVWDTPELPYKERVGIIKSMVSKYEGTSPVVSASVKVCDSKEDVLEILEEVRKLGGEGIITRSPESKYKYGRSTLKQGWLLKVKFFEDDEFKVIGFEERHHNDNEAFTNELGRTARSAHKENMIPMGMLGSLILEYKDGLTFKCGTGFSDAQRKEIWENKENYLGELAKVRYMSVGAKDLPRVPSRQGWRSKEDVG